MKVLDVCAGGMLGIAVGAPVERRYISFETKAVWWVQVLKVALGSALTAVVYYGMRVLGKLLFFDAGIRYTIRLFIVR